MLVGAASERCLLELPQRGAGLELPWRGAGLELPRGGAGLSCIATRVA